MITEAPVDFLVQRKRKRIDIVPSLGYYNSPQQVMYNADASPVQTDVSLTGSTGAAPSTPKPISIASEHAVALVSSSSRVRNWSHEAPVITVDTFLRRSARSRPPKNKKYGRRWRLRVASPAKGYEMGETDPDDFVRRSLRKCGNPPPTPSTKRRKPRRLLRKSLAQRLLDAAVSSHANLDDDALEDAGVTPTRKPLYFVTVDEEEPLSKRRRTLVDPRKDSMLPVSSFISSKHLQQTEIQTTAGRCKPLTEWEMAGDYPVTKNQVVKKKKKARRLGNSCPPLSFIPLKDAEIEYKAMLHKSSREKIQLPVGAPITPPQTSSSVQSPEPFSHQHRRSGSSPHVHFSPLQRAEPISHHSNDNERTGVIFPAFTTIESDQPTASFCLPKEVIHSIDTAGSSDDNKKVALKPLASFFGVFLESLKYAHTRIPPSQCRLRRPPPSNNIVSKNTRATAGLQVHPTITPVSPNDVNRRARSRIPSGSR